MFCEITLKCIWYTHTPLFSYILDTLQYEWWWIVAESTKSILLPTRLIRLSKHIYFQKIETSTTYHASSLSKFDLFGKKKKQSIFHVHGTHFANLRRYFCYFFNTSPLFVKIVCTFAQDCTVHCVPKTVFVWPLKGVRSTHVNVCGETFYKQIESVQRRNTQNTIWFVCLVPIKHEPNFITLCDIVLRYQKTLELVGLRKKPTC